MDELYGGDFSEFRTPAESTPACKAARELQDRSRDETILFIYGADQFFAFPDTGGFSAFLWDLPAKPGDTIDMNLVDCARGHLKRASTGTADAFAASLKQQVAKGVSAKGEDYDFRTETAFLQSQYERIIANTETGQAAALDDRYSCACAAMGSEAFKDLLERMGDEQ
ncbi:MAG: hypothetical protein ACE369_09325 [Roseovarius sp.]